MLTVEELTERLEDLRFVADCLQYQLEKALEDNCRMSERNVIANVHLGLVYEQMFNTDSSYSERCAAIKEILRNAGY